MSCYFRHLKEVLGEAGIEVNPDNRKQVDRAIHEAVGVVYKDCPAAWKNVKQTLAGDERKRQDFIARVRNGLRSQS